MSHVRWQRGQAPSPKSLSIHNLERTIRPLELRAEGRRLEGTILKYGEISPNHQERFLPGAFSLDSTTRWLDYRHDRTRILAHTEGGGLILRDSPEALLLEADLPALPLSTRAMDEIASGALQGLSIEFHAERESRDGEIRVVEKANLAGIGLVASPSYPASRVETRAAGTLSGSIPWDRSLACECYGRGQSGEGGKGMTATVEFEEGSLELTRRSQSRFGRISPHPWHPAGRAHFGQELERVAWIYRVGYPEHHVG